MNETRTTSSGKSFRLALLFLVASLLFVTGELTLAASPILPQHLIARINQQDISLEQYEAEFRLKEAKLAVLGRADEPIDEVALINRIVGDTLVLQAANEAGFQSDSALVAAELDAILGRLGITEAQMRQQLAAHDLKWSDFERSVSEYVTLSQFVDEVVLKEAPAAGRGELFDAWMAAQYDAANMQFAPEFLKAVNIVEFPPNLEG